MGCEPFDRSRNYVCHTATPEYGAFILICLCDNACFYPVSISSNQEAVPDDEGSEAIEGVDEVICRLAQMHPTQTPKRWELITRKLNRVMKKKMIPAQPMKALFAREGLCIPQCWVAEQAQAKKDRALARANKAEAEKGGFGMSLFGKKKAAAADQKHVPKEAEVGADDSDDAGETDTELDSDDDNSATGAPRAEDGEESGYRFEALSKYEVFSCMRRVHDRAGAGMIEAEDAIEDIESAEKMVSMLYELLPAQTVKEMSQHNRIKAGLRQDSLVYGEINLTHFLKVKINIDFWSQR